MWLIWFARQLCISLKKRLLNANFFVKTATGRDITSNENKSLGNRLVDEILDFERHMQDTENAMLRRENELIKRRTYVGDTPEDFEPLPDLPPPPHGYGSWLR